MRRKQKCLRHRTLHSLLATALKDLRRAETNPNCAINMGTWCLRERNGYCQVCLAGAVMVGRLSVNPSSYTYPSHYGVKTMQRLLALNDLRQGNVSRAARLMNVKGYTTGCNYRLDRVIPEYHEDTSGFWTAMTRLLADLKEHNL